MRGWGMGLILALLLFTAPARAFEECQIGSSDAGAIRDRVLDFIVTWTPVRYFEQLQAIQLSIPERSDLLMPSAFEVQGQPIVEVSLEFYRLLCRVVLATAYARDHKEYDATMRVMDSTRQCQQQGNIFRDCLIAHGEDLERQFQREYATISNEEKDNNQLIFTNAFYQIVLHEYAHIFLDHHRRIKNKKIDRIDAEYEADFFSITQATLNVTHPFAMMYLFALLSEFEVSDGHLSQYYETSYCRFRNVIAFGELYWGKPLEMIDLASMSNYFPRDFHKAHSEKSLGYPVPEFDSENCTKLGATYLQQAYTELNTLFQRLYSDVDLLLEQDPNAWPSAIPGNSRAIALLKDLIDMAVSFQWLKSLSAKLASLVIRRIGYDVGAEFVLPYIQSLFKDEKVAQNLTTPDYGRLLGQYGLAIFYGPGAWTLKLACGKASSCFWIRSGIFQVSPKAGRIWVISPS